MLVSAFDKMEKSDRKKERNWCKCCNNDHAELQSHAMLMWKAQWNTTVVDINDYILLCNIRNIILAGEWDNNKTNKRSRLSEVMKIDFKNVCDLSVYESNNIAIQINLLKRWIISYWRYYHNSTNWNPMAPFIKYMTFFNLNKVT